MTEPIVSDKLWQANGTTLRAPPYNCTGFQNAGSLGKDPIDMLDMFQH